MYKNANFEIFRLARPYLGINRKPKPFELYNKYRQNFHIEKECPCDAPGNINTKTNLNSSIDPLTHRNSIV